MELYKEYRPTKLSQMVGNPEIIETLLKMIDAGKVPQVMLFHGPPGCGKTTLARIMMSHMGCGEMDMVEMNASSVRGIDAIRALERTATLSPIGRARVTILDEVHKWTPDAQNASLKLLEDTPDNVYFFLCTTNPEKLIKALRTRCCEIPVCSLSDEDIGGILDNVVEAAGLTFLASSQHKMIADASDGSARTALVLLDRLVHLPVERWPAAILQGGGVDDDPQAIDLVRALFKINVKWPYVSSILQKMTCDPESIRWTVLMYAKAVLLKSGSSTAFEIIQSFSEPFFHNKMAGVVASAYEVVKG